MTKQVSQDEAVGGEEGDPCCEECWAWRTGEDAGGVNVSDAAIQVAVGAMFDSIQWRDGWDNAVMLIRRILEAAAPHIAAQALSDAVDAFPLETITAPDNAVVWLRHRADELGREAK